MASTLRDTTALPAGADRAAFEACPVVPPNGQHGPDPDDLATDTALEDAYAEGGPIVRRARPAATWPGTGRAT
jgi:hypothetical protein